MTESETSLQTNWDLLKVYCDLNQLYVNVSKTKVIVFTTSKSKLRNLAILQIWGTMFRKGR